MCWLAFGSKVKGQGHHKPEKPGAFMTNLRKLTNNHRTSLDSLCWFSQRCSSTPHFWGWPHIRTRPRFLYNVPTPKFHHPMFTRSEVIVLTNKHTPLKTFNALRYATLGKMFLQIFRFFGLRDSELTLDQFSRSLKTHLFKHIFGHWQLQRRVTVFFVRCAQIDLLTYLLTYLNQSVHEYGNDWHASVHFCVILPPHSSRNQRLSLDASVRIPRRTKPWRRRHWAR